MPIPRHLLFLSLILSLAQASAQEAPRPPSREIVARWLTRSATEVPGTRSPDKKTALWWTGGDTTDTTLLVWGNADHTHCLDIPDIWRHAPDMKPSDLTVLWKPDSSLVAFHDATTKHSRLQLLAIAKDAATPITVPDLAKELAKSLPAGDELASSGAVPVRWDAAGRLEVRLRGKTRSGKSPAKTIFLEVKEGRATLAK